MKKVSFLILILLLSFMTFCVTIKDSEDSYKLLGDFNNDNYVNILDLSLFANHYRTSQGDGRYDILYDIAPANLGTGEWANIYSVKNPDGVIDIRDLSIFANNYRKYVPEILPDNSLSISDETFTTYSNGTIKIHAKTINDVKGIQLEIYYDAAFFHNVEEADIEIINEELKAWMSISNFDEPGRIIYAIAGENSINIQNENIINITLMTKNVTGSTEIIFGPETKCSNSYDQDLDVNISDIGHIKIQ